MGLGEVRVAAAEGGLGGAHVERGRPGAVARLLEQRGDGGRAGVAVDHPAASQLALPALPVPGAELGQHHVGDERRVGLRRAVVHRRQTGVVGGHEGRARRGGLEDVDRYGSGRHGEELDHGASVVGQPVEQAAHPASRPGGHRIAGVVEQGAGQRGQPPAAPVDRGGEVPVVVAERLHHQRPHRRRGEGPHADLRGAGAVQEPPHRAGPGGRARRQREDREIDVTGVELIAERVHLVVGSVVGVVDQDGDGSWRGVRRRRA